jgi:hypothetical protein
MLKMWYTVGQLVEVLCYKPEECAFEFCCHSIYQLLPATLWPLGLAHPLTEMSTKNLTNLIPKAQLLCHQTNC